MLPRAKGGNIAILGRLPCSKQRYMLLLFQFNQNAVQILWMKENNRLSVSTNLRFWIEHLITHKHQKSWFLCQKEKERERKKGRILLCPSVSNLLLQHICHPPDENYSTSVGAGRKDWMCVCVGGGNILISIDFTSRQMWWIPPEGFFCKKFAIGLFSPELGVKRTHERLQETRVQNGKSYQGDG